ncbi:MAG: sodium:solute symporter family protein [Armatimonadetes bacterium]|nr:sodium:solute symporter family protein [Armatimonadota bacterium]
MFIDEIHRIWIEHPLWITWGVVAVYILFIFIKGVSKVSKIEDADDFLVAGRSVGWFFLFCTMGATVIGGGGSIGAVGKTYDWGILMLLVSTGWYIHFIFSGLVVAPRFREAKLYTVAGYFGHRFGEGPRFVAMVLSLLFSVFIVAAQMAAFGLVLASTLPNLTENLTQSGAMSQDMVLNLAILIGGLLVVIYSTAGGLLAVIHTDIYQFIVLMGGFAITLALLVPDLSANWGSIFSELPSEFFQAHGGKGWIFLITTFLAFLLGETFAPGYATRYCIGKDIKNTKIGIAGVGAFLALTFPAVLFFIAAYARLYFPDIEPQLALPMVVRKLNNPLVGGIIIGALLSAVMSSADSALNSSTAIFVKDLFEHQLKWKDGHDGRMLKLARLCSAALGIVAILIAAVWSDIIGLLLFTYQVWAPAIIVPVVFGVLSRDDSPRTSRQILVTMVATTVLTFIYRLTPYSASFDPAVFGVLLATIIFLAQRRLAV